MPKIPFLMNSTAIAARIIPMTLEITFVQCSPNTLYNFEELIRISHVANNVRNPAITVTKVPLSLTRIIVVIITPGPVSNGVPIGTLKSLLLDFAYLGEIPNTYITPSINKMMPPAIWKLLRLTPKKLKI